MSARERGITQEKDPIPSDCPVVVNIYLVIDSSRDFRSLGRRRGFSRHWGRRSQRDRDAVVDIRRAAKISAAAVLPSPSTDNADIPSIADLPVRAALSPHWRAAVCAALVACKTVAPVRATGSPPLNAAAEGVAGVSAGTGTGGATTNAVGIGPAVNTARTALRCRWTTRGVLRERSVRIESSTLRILCHANIHNV